MRKSSVISLIIFAFTVRRTASQDTLKIDFLKQKLDHFDPTNNGEWNMKFLSHDSYHRRGGPMFINVGGEYAMEDYDLVEGHFFDIGKEIEAYFFQIEHRYYGDNHPTADMSLPNMKHLNMQQAMADLAHFIRAMKVIFADLAHSKVILFGISYAGGLAFWFKHLYPDLVDGVWASSPALYGLLNFHEAYKIVGDSIKLVGTDQCYDRIKDGLAVLESMMTKEQEDEVKRLLNICPQFDTSNKLDVWNVFAIISTNLGNIVQRHTPANEQINILCEVILHASNPLSGLVEFLKKTALKNPECNDVSFQTIVAVTSEQRIFREIESPRPFDYQRCHEFGWFTTSENPDSIMRSVPLTYYLRKCAEVFRDQPYTVDDMNRMITGYKDFFNKLVTRTNNIIVTHGELDPWKAVGTLSHIHVEMIPLVGHGLDLDSISSADTQTMRRVKEKVKNSIRGWVEEDF